MNPGLSMLTIVVLEDATLQHGEGHPRQLRFSDTDMSKESVRSWYYDDDTESL